MTIYKIIENAEKQLNKYREGKSVMSALLSVASDRTASDALDAEGFTKKQEQLEGLANAALTLWEDVPKILEDSAVALHEFTYSRLRGSDAYKSGITAEHSDLIARILTIPNDKIKQVHKRVLWAVEGWEE